MIKQINVKFGGKVAFHLTISPDLFFHFAFFFIFGKNFCFVFVNMGPYVKFHILDFWHFCVFFLRGSNIGINGKLKTKTISGKPLVVEQNGPKFGPVV